MLPQISVQEIDGWVGLGLCRAGIHKDALQATTQCESGTTKTQFMIPQLNPIILHLPNSRLLPKGLSAARAGTFDPNELLNEGVEN